MPSFFEGSSSGISTYTSRSALGMIGKLLRTWYGTQDASNLWQKHYTDLIGKLDYTPGVSNRAVFYSKAQDARMLVHGDNFVLLADADAADAMLKLLQSQYTV